MIFPSQDRARIRGLGSRFISLYTSPDVLPSETVTLTFVVEILVLLLLFTFDYFSSDIEGIIPSSSFWPNTPLPEVENVSSKLSRGASGIKFDSPGISSDWLDLGSIDSIIP